MSSVRLDVWLDVACIFKTRSEAQKAIKGGKVDVNGQNAKAQKLVKSGDVLDITRPYGRKMRVIVEGVTENHIPKADARKLYEDVTPPPSPAEQQLLDLMKLAGPKRRHQSLGSPDRDERRRLRRAKEGGL
ncbi:MAG: RNA-binding S4 domain-containing protein [Acidobacteria bacterium]|nr:MAG: RNA-binding S4 domain-containing protein [Acidobacteriota bacterium]